MDNIVNPVVGILSGLLIGYVYRSAYEYFHPRMRYSESCAKNWRKLEAESWRKVVKK